MTRFDAVVPEKQDGRVWARPHDEEAGRYGAPMRSSRTRREGVRAANAEMASTSFAHEAVAATE